MTSISRPATQSRVTVISPAVSVPVLSVQTTVEDPSASTAGSFRMSALRPAMRRRPTASAMVATAGRPSGTAAIARAMPASSIRAAGTPWTIPSPVTTAATASVTHTSRRPRTSSRRSSGVFSSSIPPTSAPIRPTCVRAPVATITARPPPAATPVPL